MDMRFTLTGFLDSKRTGRKITMLTAYDFTTARIIDSAGVDAILVGDSLGVTMLGYDSVLRVTMDDMLHHIKAVSRGVKNAFIIGDMPFLSYGINKPESAKNAGRLVAEGGCNAVKLEGGRQVIDDIKAIISIGIPVIGHLGFTPQSLNLLGGRPKAQGKTLETARRIAEDSLMLQDAGVSAIVLECVPYRLAAHISSKLEIPAIGIGSGPSCDGQVLVINDILGLDSSFSPKHSKKYMELCTDIGMKVKQYIGEVQSNTFPTAANSFIIEEEIIEKL